MARIGVMNRLPVLQDHAQGVILDGGDLGSIILPRRFARRSRPGDEVEVFVYRDGEDRLVATTDVPLAQVGRFAFLEVVSTSRVGAFLDWGLDKDLFVPHREQRERMVVGRSYVVFVYLDPVSDRIVASSRLNRHVSKERHSYRLGQEVDLIIDRRSDLGTNAIVDHAHWGVILRNEPTGPLRPGQSLKGFIKRVRESGKLDLSLQRPGYGKVTDLTQVILDHLEQNEGFMPITDRSSPEEIRALFDVSKKTYKKAIGALYRKRRVRLEHDGTYLNPS